MKYLAILAGFFLSAAGVFAENPPTSCKFQFGPGPAAPGYTLVSPGTIYSQELGYGFEPGAAVQAVAAAGTDPLHSGFATSGNLFIFSVAIPEGNYQVTVTLGGAKEGSATTVKAESRRLMLEHIQTGPGEFVSRSFYVSVRRPQLPDGTKLKLDVQEIDPSGKLLTYTWDDKLSLEFCDTKPGVAAIEITPAVNPITVFIIGDSTVTDQHAEPYGTWGQMLARWFKEPVVVANFAESGETLKAFRREHRWDKILGEIKPGDYVFMQFGHNDLNKTGHNAIWPADDHDGDWPNTYVEGEDYKNLLKQYAAEIKAKGATPVIVSPMTKINSQTGAVNVAGLRNYPKDAMDAAKEAGVAAIDLNAMSIAVDQALALGPAMSQQVYTREGLHQRTYGGYLFSRCIVEGIKQDKLDLAKYLVDDAGTFDPAHPLPLPADFKVPLEPAPPGGFGRGRGAGRGAGPAGAATNPAPAPAPVPAATSSAPPATSLPLNPSPATSAPAGN